MYEGVERLQGGIVGSQAWVSGVVRKREGRLADIWTDMNRAKLGS